ncbi:MAG: hypothetical protein ACYDH2_13810 [Anaerolineaceae bacterium]
MENGILKIFISEFLDILKQEKVVFLNISRGANRQKTANNGINKRLGIGVGIHLSLQGKEMAKIIRMTS